MPGASLLLTRYYGDLINMKKEMFFPAFKLSARLIGAAVSRLKFLDCQFTCAPERVVKVGTQLYLNRLDTLLASSTTKHQVRVARQVDLCQVRCRSIRVLHRRTLCLRLFLLHIDVQKPGHRYRITGSYQAPRHEQS